MKIDHHKSDEAALALTWLTLHNERQAWKSSDQAVTDRLYLEGLHRWPGQQC
jgi:hypothetical protein